MTQATLNKRRREIGEPEKAKEESKTVVAPARGVDNLHKNSVSIVLVALDDR